MSIFDEELLPHIFEDGKDAILLFTDSLDEDYVRIFEDSASRLRSEAIFAVSGGLEGI